jgi:hypothetical protein
MIKHRDQGSGSVFTRREADMSLRKRIVLAVVWIASLLATGLWAHAQSRIPAVPPPTPPVIISGSDVGFRIERQSGNVVVGTWVVRINGQWVVPESSVGIKRLSAR